MQASLICPLLCLGHVNFCLQVSAQPKSSSFSPVLSHLSLAKLQNGTRLDLYLQPRSRSPTPQLTSFSEKVLKRALFRLQGIPPASPRRHGACTQTSDGNHQSQCAKRDLPASLTCRSYPTFTRQQRSSKQPPNSRPNASTKSIFPNLQQPSPSRAFSVPTTAYHPPH